MYLTLAANFLFLNTIFVSVPKGPPSTTIAVSSSRAGRSDRVHVVCTVLGEPDVDVNFRWQYPGQEVRGVCSALPEIVCSSQRQHFKCSCQFRHAGRRRQHIPFELQPLFPWESRSSTGRKLESSTPVSKNQIQQSSLLPQISVPVKFGLWQHFQRKPQTRSKPTSSRRLF